MGNSITPVATELDRMLPSGRSVQLKLAARGEEIEVRSPSGEVEVRISFTREGPVVTVHGGRLELAAPDIAIECKTLSVAASHGVSVDTGRDLAVAAKGEVSVVTTRDIHMNGSVIRLNCTDEESASGRPGAQGG